MRYPTLRTRRLLVRLALLFAILQGVALAGMLFALPAMRTFSPAPVIVLVLLGVDLALLVTFAGWLTRDLISTPLDRLSSDVQRIADGDYHHRAGDPTRPELADIRDSVNRLADRLIAEQRRLAENIESLDHTNRELRMARDQVVRSARLASVGTLAAGIAHEVGNPLGAIMGFVDVARSRVEKAGGDVELLDSIRGEAVRIDRIVRGLLDYARPPGTGTGPAPAESVVTRVRDLLESQGKLDAVESEWLVEGAAEHIVHEPHRLEQVIINLVLNALHAVRDRGNPRVRVRLYEEEGALHTMPARREDDPPGINYMHRRRLERDQDGVASSAAAERLTVIEVMDNGHGIPPEHIDQLFDPFFTTKEPGEGTGLGLSICARLIEGMGGEIEADHNPDGGARFVIRLPLMYDTDDEPSHSEATERA